MATRSRVAIVFPENYRGEKVVRSIYSHYDGYPNGVGVTLVRHYAERDDAEALVSLGDAQGVRGPLAEHVDKRTPYVMRGEAHHVAKHRSVEELMSDTHVLEEFLYVFENGLWTAYDTRDGRMELVDIPQG